MTWRKIDSAPRDGTFLVFMPEEDKVHSSQIAIARYHPNVKVINGKFSFDMPEPTHWQPLPAPPEDET